MINGGNQMSDFQCIIGHFNNNSSVFCNGEVLMRWSSPGFDNRPLKPIGVLLKFQGLLMSPLNGGFHDGFSGLALFLCANGLNSIVYLIDSSNFSFQI
jgi:hypothetical protein